MGRGAATMYAGSLADADLIIIEGSNMAENHPVAFRWVMAAKEKGAKLIHVDPRFTRTSAVADLYAPIRTGTDIAFLGQNNNQSCQYKRQPVAQGPRTGDAGQSGQQPVPSGQAGQAGQPAQPPKGPPF